MSSSPGKRLGAGRPSSLTWTRWPTPPRARQRPGDPPAQGMGWVQGAGAGPGVPSHPCPASARVQVGHGGRSLKILNPAPAWSLTQALGSVLGEGLSHPCSQAPVPHPASWLHQPSPLLHPYSPPPRPAPPAPAFPPLCLGLLPATSVLISPQHSHPPKYIIPGPLSASLWRGPPSHRARGSWPPQQTLSPGSTQ